MNLTQGFQTPKGLLSNFSTAKIARFFCFSKGERGDPGREGEDGTVGIKVGDNGHL